MYKLIPYDETLDLTDFYAQADARGFHNNSSRKQLIDNIGYEQEWRVWFLMYNNKIVGSTAAHTMDELGPDSYRIAARTCSFSDMLPLNRVRTLTGIIEHQNHSAQFYLPAGIDYFGKDKNFFITSNAKDFGTQRRVHKTWCPTMERSGVLSKECEMEYRGTLQTIWRVHVDMFYDQLDLYGRWPIERIL
jgi:hypothetical protein|tara:strand:+ start:92 stop:661 length:570 start_codon:yes stop_codon:yes gene_type:complete